MKAYSKTFAALGVLLATVGEVLADGAVSATEVGLVATAAAGVVAVFAVRNKKA